MQKIVVDKVKFRSQLLALASLLAFPFLFFYAGTAPASPSCGVVDFFQLGCNEKYMMPGPPTDDFDVEASLSCTPGIVNADVNIGISIGGFDCTDMSINIGGHAETNSITKDWSQLTIWTDFETHRRLGLNETYQLNAHPDLSDAVSVLAENFKLGVNVHIPSDDQ